MITMKGEKGSLAKILSLIIILVVALSACSDTENNDGLEDQEGASNVHNVTYEADVKEIITNSCIACHGDSSPKMAEFAEDPDKFAAMMQGPRLNDYENLTVVVNGAEAGALMRRLDNGENKENGEPGNMYQYLGATDEEREEKLEVLKEWVGHWSMKRENELTDEDREQFYLYEN